MVLESKFGSPRIVNDGVTVAKEVELEDPVENIGAKLVRQVRHERAGHLIYHSSSRSLSCSRSVLICWIRHEQCSVCKDYLSTNSGEAE